MHVQPLPSQHAGGKRGLSGCYAPGHPEYAYSVQPPSPAVGAAAKLLEEVGQRSAAIDGDVRHLDVIGSLFRLAWGGPVELDTPVGDLAQATLPSAISRRARVTGFSARLPPRLCWTFMIVRARLAAITTNV